MLAKPILPFNRKRSTCAEVCDSCRAVGFICCDEFDSVVESCAVTGDEGSGRFYGIDCSEEDAWRMVEAGEITA